MTIVVQRPNALVRCYLLFALVASYFQSLALLALRIGIGSALIVSGWSHLHDINMMVERFKRWHIPHPLFNVYVSGTTEAVGGALLILGLATRLISLPLIVNFVVAYATASRSEFGELRRGLHAGPASAWDAWGDIVNDSAMPFLAASIITLAFGPGLISLDALIRRILVGRRLQTVVAADTSVVVPARTVTTTIPMSESPAAMARPNVVEVRDDPTLR
jgi:putative oxidoreductase